MTGTSHHDDILRPGSEPLDTSYWGTWLGESVVLLSCLWASHLYLVGSCDNRGLDSIDLWADPAGLFLRPYDV